MLGKCGTTALLIVCTHIDNLDVAQVELQTRSHTVQTIGVAQQDRLANTFGLGLYGCFQHGGVAAFGEYHALRMQAGCVVQLAGEFCLLT